MSNNQKIMKTEQGRSMVEMLGVLAVMGVLSVAGIAGYNSAMNKYRANELLNEASKRATVVAMQMASGRAANIDEFKVNGSQNFTVSGNAGDTTFTLTIANVDEAICRQLVTMAGTTGMVRKVTSGGTDTAGDASKCTSGALVLTYNADLSNKEISGGGAESSIDVGTCANGNVYLSYNVGTECDTTTPQNMGCTKNSDCDSGEYCKLTGAYQNHCSEITGGTCETLDAGRETTYTDPNDTTKTKTFLVSSGYMSWWAADNWCKAHDMKLVSYSTVNRLFDCDKDEYSCTWSKFTTSGNWSNGTLPDYYWTAESYDSCDAWDVRVVYGGFYYDNRGGDDFSYALCE